LVKTILNNYKPLNLLGGFFAAFWAFFSGIRARLIYWKLTNFIKIKNLPL